MSSTSLSNYFRKASLDSHSKPRASLTVEDINVKGRSLSIDSNKNRYSTGVHVTQSTKKQSGFLTSLFSRPKGKGKAVLATTDNVLPRSSNLSFTNYDRESDIRPSDSRITLAIDESGEETLSDPIYNLMDNYAALLCCSVIHAKLIDSLCFLATHAESSLATKSRDLLVDILRTASNIFPEGNCSDLLAMPFLIEFASAAWTNNLSSRAEKASHVLLAMTEAFSATSIEQFHLYQYKSPEHTQTTQENLNQDDSINISTPNSNRQINSGRNIGNLTASKSQNSSLKIVSSSPSSIFDIAEEVKQTSQSRVFSLIESSSNQLQSKSKLMHVLRLTLISIVDKTDFNKQMESSKVLGKDGKEPLKWDWCMINDMLEFSFQHSDRLSEALKTKWVRRLSGFYRCTSDEKAFFANMDWDISNLHYLENACNLYHVLVEDEQGMSFLTSDRRGLLFNDISREMEQLIDSASRSSVISTTVKNVFRPFACRHTMAREYFTLLGRLTTTPQGSLNLLFVLSFIFT